MMSAPYDVIVVGAGVMGSAAAHYAAAGPGRPSVLLLEARAFLHRTGSSHGESRIVRKTYADAELTRMMAERAYPLWRGLEAEASTTLLHTTGGLNVVVRGSATHLALVDACASAGVAHTTLTPPEALARHGLRLADDEVIVQQEDSGVVGATKVVATLQALARGTGVVLRDHCPVRAVRRVAGADAPPLFEVEAESGEVFVGRKVLLCPGPWAGPLLHRLFGLTLSLEVWQCSVMYFKAPEAGGEEAERGLRALPVIIDYGRGGSPTLHAHHPVAAAASASAAGLSLDIPVYSCPSLEFPGLVKFAVHRGLPTTADTRTFVPDHALTVAPVQEWLRGRLPALVDADRPVFTETCLYTMSPDEDFVIDTLPLPGLEGHVFVAGAGSGHAFKFGPLIGKVLAELAQGKGRDELSVDIRRFSLLRPSLKAVFGGV